MTSGVMLLPLGDITTRKPQSDAYLATSKMSARCRGSPPLIIKIGLQNSAIWSIMAWASFVVSWFGSACRCALGSAVLAGVVAGAGGFPSDDAGS